MKPINIFLTILFFFLIYQKCFSQSIIDKPVKKKEVQKKKSKKDTPVKVGNSKKVFILEPDNNQLFLNKL